MIKLPNNLYINAILKRLNTNLTIHVPVDDSVSGGKASRRSLIRKKTENKIPELVQKIEEVDTSENKIIEGAQEKVEEKVNLSTDSTAQTGNPQALLMVEVVNITHEKFRQTEEIKVRLYHISYFLNTYHVLIYHR